MQISCRTEIHEPVLVGVDSQVTLNFTLEEGLAPGRWGWLRACGRAALGLCARSRVSTLAKCSVQKLWSPSVLLPKFLQKINRPCYYTTTWALSTCRDGTTGPSSEGCPRPPLNPWGVLENHTTLVCRSPPP